MDNNGIFGSSPLWGGASVICGKVYLTIATNNNVMRDVFANITVESIIETSVHALIGCAVGYVFKVCVNKIKSKNYGKNNKPV